MQNDAMPYLLNSLSIIRKNFSPLFLLIAASTIFYIPMIQKSSNILYFFLGFASMFFFYPSIYGQYTEITLYNRQIRYAVLFKRHWLNFVIVSLLLGLPIIILSLFSSILEIDLDSLKLIYSILVSSLSIYVLPLLFIHGKRWESIKVGFQCVAGNFSFNLPLIIIVSVTTTLAFNFRQIENGTNNTYSLTVYGVITILSLIVEFWLFVSAILILKDKGLA
ncbi:MAG: hypothetical protein KKE44_21370 [Proteobacteria bacterium]|nr:hypothetical protein [Pseudomonadota bacterium]MBU1585284.1 hypothetical protein [Pseudomonadota bacterium]MBU2455280.1 hypothetical protein [Pseudomonadota bacterium]